MEGLPRSNEEQARYVDGIDGLNPSLKGYKEGRKSLLTNIDFSHVLPDTLHMFLRPTDKMEESLIKSIAALDEFAIKSGCNAGDFVKYPNIGRYFETLDETCGLKLKPFARVTNGRGKLK